MNVLPKHSDTFLHLGKTDPKESQSASGTSADLRLHLQKSPEVLIQPTQKLTLVRGYQQSYLWSTPVNTEQIDSELGPHRNATDSPFSQNILVYVMKVSYNTPLISNKHLGNFQISLFLKK